MSLGDPCICWLWYVVNDRIAKLFVLLLTEGKIESPVSTYDYVAPILGMARKPMVQKCLTATRTSYWTKGTITEEKKEYWIKGTVSFTDDRNLIAGKNEQPSVIDTEQNVQTTQEIINIPPFLNNQRGMWRYGFWLVLYSMGPFMPVRPHSAGIC